MEGLVESEGRPDTESGVLLPSAIITRAEYKAMSRVYTSVALACPHGCLPRTHSRARIQPRNSSFVVVKTMSSGVPHCRS